MGLNQISDPSPENPRLRRRLPGVNIGGTLGGGFANLPVPSLLTQTSNSPALSARKATNRPSGEISACSSVPCQSVTLEKVALASGLGAGRRLSHTPTARASATNATQGSHFT